MRGEDPKLGHLLCQLEWLWVSRECLLELGSSNE